ncbi:hypothetical protein HW130_08790 [Streptomyces sp. PKU-EA00015]|uniref:hypothetical protein n=1 Tax=Streptomyces sp. PKU-EA00015 TaxID=2748326 RepID=UPI0015A3C529|nr:hypothetical protein [Streptomyces sp. PKU-EA00015]NWF26368.1 hypothetical protein [Streptomyces sp. PKU-EA00015]
MKTRLSALGVCALFAAMPHGVAHADETHVDSHNGHSVTLVSTGQIDDPLEDVLEHVAVLGGVYTGG